MYAQLKKRIVRGRRRPAFGQTTGASTVLPAVTVTAPRDLESQPTDAASEQRISGETLNTRPVTRPGEILEAVPGLIVTQHSGEGKANQYFLRGFNLDHGTDIGINLDGMPVNMRSHAHGQGYSDLNFLIPELVDNLLVRKGPYWAQEGDFLFGGAVHLAMPTGWRRTWCPRPAAALATGAGWRPAGPAGAGTLTGAGEIDRYNGPWDVPDNVRKYNGVLRYTEGTADNGFALTGMAYTNAWHATNQTATRAVDQGIVDRFGTLDPTDGGDTQRYSLSARWSRSDDRTADKVEGYFIASTLNLYSNFTFFLNDPVNGDQFQQSDKRHILGANASHTVDPAIAGLEAEGMVGLQLRHDDIDPGLFNTVNRVAISTIRTDHVIGDQRRASTCRRRRSRGASGCDPVGMRGRHFPGHRRQQPVRCQGSSTTAFLPSPKAGLVFGPFAKTEFLPQRRHGAITQRRPRHRGGAHPPRAIAGAEVGMRTQAIRGLDSTVSLFVLDFDSELVFDGDTGDTQPSRPSRRIGVEWTNRYRPVPWPGSTAIWPTPKRASPGRQRSRSAIFVPEAPAIVASAGDHPGRGDGLARRLRAGATSVRGR